MLDNMMRLREPAAWAVIAVTAASIVLALVRLVLALGTGGELSAAAQDVSLQAMNLTLVLVVVALVWACVFHAPTPGAPRVATAAAVVVTIGTVLTIAGAVLGLTASAGMIGVVLEFLGGLLDIVLKLIACTTLWLIHRGLRGGRIRGELARPGSESPGRPELAGPGPDAEVVGRQPPAGPAPSWTAESATGIVWSSASEAAQGAPASGRGVPGAASGWRPVSRPGPQDSPPGDPAAQ